MSGRRVPTAQPLRRRVQRVYATPARAPAVRLEQSEPRSRGFSGRASRAAAVVQLPSGCEVLLCLPPAQPGVASARDARLLHVTPVEPLARDVFRARG